jgi:hypothetical protein
MGDGLLGREMDGLRKRTGGLKRDGCLEEGWGMGGREEGWGMGGLKRDGWLAKRDGCLEEGMGDGLLEEGWLMGG